MKKIKSTLIFILIMFLCIFFMIWYSMGSDSLKVVTNQNETINFSGSEQKYIEHKKTIKISVDSKLDYMDIHFIEDYVKSVIAPSGLGVELVENEKNADVRLVIVTDKLKYQTDKYQFTAPLFSLDGTLFVNVNYEDGSRDNLSGVCVNGDFTEIDLNKMSYNGCGIDFVKFDSVEEAVRYAKDEDVDCIAGEQYAVAAYLRTYDIEQKYQNQFTDFFTDNVCILLPADEEVLYSILNQCVHNADLPVLARQAQENSFGIADSFVKDNLFKDATALIVIIFAAVLITFFIYYQSNKNLYNELKERMDELLASKQEMKSTFNGVSYLMAEIRPDGSILDINTAFMNYVNVDCIDRNVGKVLELPDDVIEKLNGMIDETNNTGTGSTGEIVVGRKIFEINIFPIRQKKGDIEKLLFMAADVTGERMAERQMLQDNKMIAVGQLAAGVAHEIRNPLGVIRNYCYVLKNMKDEDMQKQAVQVIEKSVDSAGNIIDNLLNFSKIKDSRIEKVYIRKHIEDVLALNKGLLKKKQISATVECEDDFIVSLAVESFDMVLINLVTNAIDAMTESGLLQIDIKHENDYFSVSVTDNGTGIDKDIMDDIFNPFFTTKSTVEGTGLGLYIVYNEIQKMNGDINVTSEIGVGTTFNVVLPCRLEGENID